MLQSRSVRVALLCGLLVSVLSHAAEPGPVKPGTANRLTYLDEEDPFYPNAAFPKLTTPQWVGETGVEAVVILAIDDMRQPEKYEPVLRPILERLKQIDGRAPVSIMCNRLDPFAPQLKSWQAEGLSLEVHTMEHPCPLLSGSNFVAAARNFHESVELLNRVPGNRPVAFRMPCCDSIDSPSPRFYAEIFNQTNQAGQFLTLDSSVMNILTSADPTLPRDLVLDANGQERFRKYVPFQNFVTTIENYPYPYVIGRRCWELPAMVPSDWEAQHVHGTNNPITIADWKAALDATVLKQGTFTFIFHPHGWIRPDQMVQFIDYAVQRYGRTVKFLTFKETDERLRTNLLAGHPLRSESGEDNGVRLLDLNNDGYLDVVIGNPGTKLTRVWSPANRQWQETRFPVPLVTDNAEHHHVDTGVRFGVLEPNGMASLLVNGSTKGAWHFDGQQWVERKLLLDGLELNGQPILTSVDGRDRGVRFRDVDADGRCELIVSNPDQNAVFAWAPEEETWKKLSYGLPPGASIVDAFGKDTGIRFVDINQDGFDDVVFSNPSAYSLHLFVPKLFLGFQQGWSRVVLFGHRGEAGEIPMISRGGATPNNGAWFHSRHLWVQNEDTANFKDHVDQRSFDELLGGLQPKAQSPQESLSSMRPRPGFKVELVASEPLVQDPIAFEWGADGKLWVVEMGDYPLGTDGHGKPGGVVRFLEDTDGDGRYDRSTVFLDGVNFPTGLMPWGKGVIVSAAPEIFYAEDTDGDGKADRRVPLFRGFVEGNQQHRLNGFDYGLDNWLYGANGDSGGRIRCVGALSGNNQDLPQAMAELRGHDFRFRPAEGRFETVSGQTQYGRHRDDWGNWFGNNNPTWLWHVVLPEQYLARNPHLPVRSVKEILANYPNATRVFPSSRSMQRFNDVAMLNHVTSANSAMPYRDDLFGPEFATSVFISEPVHNTVHREVLEPNGVTFQSHRAPDEQQREFLSSTDNWFRPTMIKTGPDGALYIADMYRLVIEHPEWIPADSQAHLDLRAGHDQGRLYRTFPVNATLRPIPHLDRLDPASLAAQLDSPSGWVRDTVQRLLVASAPEAAVAPLAHLVRESRSAKTRLQAICTLDGMGRLQPELLEVSLRDPHPSVREHGIRLSEPFLRAANDRRSAANGKAISALQARLLDLVSDPEVRVRFQLAFTLGEWPSPQAAKALVKLATKDQENSAVQTAVLSSAVPHVGTMLETLFASRSTPPPIRLAQELVSLAITVGQDQALVGPVRALATRAGDGYAPWQLEVAQGIVRSAERRDGSMARFREHAPANLQQALDDLQDLFQFARRTALDATRPEPERVAATHLLGHGLADKGSDLGHLSELLRPQVPAPIQHAALESLSGFSAPEIGELLLSGWKSYEPQLRTDVLTLLLSRSDWTEKLLRALETGSVASGQISLAQRQKMLASSQEQIRERARQLFTISADRHQLLQDFRQVREMEGDKTKGAAVFAQTCATCHRLHDVGFNVGPDLGALTSKSPQTLLTAILDPNQAVEARYIAYTAVTKSDREISGIIVADTPSSVTLRSAGGAEETILRSDLQDLSSSGLSLMPEGFEKVLTRQDLADLIAFLNSPQ